ncbi:MAG TPA: pantoate--beta-alanine ligase [Candidatus Limnocylindrales bacterium]|nr:pantoate--beta-alanine ligase [Candidatus Limnocylindrales bacterium]
MEVVRDRAALGAARAGLTGPVGLVPTMGALHAGHESLVRRAREECASVVASIFVNPTQFGPNEDFERYPRSEAADLALLDAAGVDLCFLPAVEEIYPPGASTSVDVGQLGEVLEGAARPGHLRGVATVVTILLALIRPDRAYLGQKDGQQAIVVRRLVHDLGLTPTIVVCPTIREPDGLALSSRNAYLGAAERSAAGVLSRALMAAQDAYASGERSAKRLRGLMRTALEREPLAQVDYVSVADVETLEELTEVDRPAMASLAVRLPSTRLIDCLVLGDPAGAGLPAGD